MNPSTPENPYRVLLGSSFTLFLAVFLALPLAYLGIVLYVAVSGAEVSLQISPAASVWELRLNPERTASDEHERLREEIELAFPEGTFLLTEREGETWLATHARSIEVFQAARKLAGERGYDSGELRLPGAFDKFSSRSMEASFAWFGEHPGAILAAVSSQSLSFGLVGLILMIRCRKRKFVWAASTLTVGRQLLEGLLGGVVLLSAAFLIERLSSVLGRPVVEQTWVTKIQDSGGEAAWMLAFLVIVLAPIAEEIFFRGYLFQSLQVRISTPLAMAVSTAYFAGVHGNPSGLFVYLLLGVGLAYLHWRTRSLLAPILAHSLVNAVALLA